MPFTIFTAKELTVAPQPVYLVVFKLQNGLVYRCSTHPLNQAQGGVAPSGISGFPYNGQQFTAKLESSSLEAIQSMAEDGVDTVPNVTFNLSDPSGALLTQTEYASGFSGAEVDVWFTFHDVQTGEYAQDAERLFLGVCGMASHDGARLQVSATNMLSFGRTIMPSERVSHRCIWNNPATNADRAAANDPDSPFYRCGETRSISAAPPCENTKATCTQPLRFSGSTFVPLAVLNSRSYADKKRENYRSSNNPDKIGVPIPIIYGTAPVEPVVMNVIPEGNSTRLEALVCSGQLAATRTQIGRVRRVILNGNVIPHVSQSPDPKLFRWEWVNPGLRDGQPNGDALYDGKGDPYGSLAVMTVCTYKEHLSGESAPQMEVLTDGPDIRVYTSASSYTMQMSSNPAWIILDFLKRCGRRYSLFNIESFMEVASRCAASIPTLQHNGSTTISPRYDFSLAITKRRTAPEILRAMLRAINGNLSLNPRTGLYEITMRATLAEQQSSPVAGSNDNSPVPSFRVDGTPANGYLAYHLTEDHILTA